MNICGELVAAGLHLVSGHSGPMPNGQPYEWATPGVYVRCETGVQFGAFRNSEGGGSLYRAYVYEVPKTLVFFAAGGALGYEGRAIAPIGGVGIKIGDNLRLMGFPPVSHDTVGLLTAMWEMRF